MNQGMPLPDFDTPPVVEVVLSVQFEPLKGLRLPHMGLLWAEFRSKFPRIEEHPPIEPVFERFDTAPRQFALGPQLRVFQTPPLPRCWFLDANGTELIQIQTDRFIHNWRRIGDRESYPRYPRLRETLSSELGQFQAFLSREKLGPLRPNQCEVTYVNHIPAGVGWASWGELGHLLTVFVDRQSGEFLPRPEDARGEVRYPIVGPDGKPIGRLHISFEPAYRKTDGQPMYVVNLTARVRPVGEGIEGALDALNLGRRWVVCGFVSVTTPEMHKLWGLKNANGTA